MLSDDVHLSRSVPVRQSDNLTDGGTFSVGRMPSGVAKPNSYNTIGEFTDGYGEGDADDQRGAFGGSVGSDFFSSLGEERRRKEIPKKPNPDAAKMSSREINTAIYSADGERLASSTEAIAGNHNSTNAPAKPSTPAPGSTGSNWRMMKLKRVYETAEEEKRPVEDVGIERFGNLDLYEAALEERRFLDDRGGRSGTRTPISGLPGRMQRQQQQHRPGYGRSNTAGSEGSNSSIADSIAELDEFGREKRKEPVTETANVGTPSGTRYIFNDPASASGSSSRPPSRQGSFRRPGSYTSADEASRPSTPIPASGHQQQPTRGGSKPSTPIPSVFTPPPTTAMRKPSHLQTSTLASEQALGNAVASSQNNEGLVSEPPMSPSSLNKLQAQILRMRLMNGDAAELKKLEERYEKEQQRARQGDAAAVDASGYFNDTKEAGRGGDEQEVRVLPTLDGRGRLYDVGRGGKKTEEEVEEERRKLPGNKRKRKEKVCFHCSHAIHVHECAH